MEDTAEYCCLLSVDPDHFIQAGKSYLENILTFALLLIRRHFLNGANLFISFNTIHGCNIKFLGVLILFKLHTLYLFLFHLNFL